MAFDIGIDFRQTSGYVVDPADCTYCLAENYPVTRGGATFGWVSPIGSNARNRNSALDPRLAGVCYQWGGDTTKKLFRIDLPASGDVMVYCAIGDAGGANYGYLEVFDDTTSLGVLVTSKLVSPTASFYDATDTLLTAANWPGSNAGVPLTFSTTTMIVAVTPGDSTSSNFAIAHLRVASAGSPPVTIDLVVSPLTQGAEINGGAITQVQQLVASPLTQNAGLSVGGITQIQELSIASLSQVSHAESGAITVSSGEIDLVASPLTQVNALQLADASIITNNSLVTKYITQ